MKKPIKQLLATLLILSFVLSLMCSCNTQMPNSNDNNNPPEQNISRPADVDIAKFYSTFDNFIKRNPYYTWWRKEEDLNHSASVDTIFSQYTSHLENELTATLQNAEALFDSKDDYSLWRSNVESSYECAKSYIKSQVGLYSQWNSMYMHSSPRTVLNQLITDTKYFCFALDCQNKGTLSTDQLTWNTDIVYDEKYDYSDAEDDLSYTYSPTSHKLFYEFRDSNPYDAYLSEALKSANADKTKIYNEYISMWKDELEFTLDRAISLYTYDYPINENTEPLIPDIEERRQQYNEMRSATEARLAAIDTEFAYEMASLDDPGIKLYALINYAEAVRHLSLDTKVYTYEGGECIKKFSGISEKDYLCWADN